MFMADKDMLIKNIDKIHTTPMGVRRIASNLDIADADAVGFCKRLILDGSCKIYRSGKNYYCENAGVTVTVNAGSYTIITAHRK